MVPRRKNEKFGTAKMQLFWDVTRCRFLVCLTVKMTALRPKHRCLFTNEHDLMSRKTGFFISLPRQSQILHFELHCSRLFPNVISCQVHNATCFWGSYWFGITVLEPCHIYVEKLSSSLKKSLNTFFYKDHVIILARNFC